MIDKLSKVYFSINFSLSMWLIRSVPFYLGDPSRGVFSRKVCQAPILSPTAIKPTAWILDSSKLILAVRMVDRIFKIHEGFFGVPLLEKISGLIIYERRWRIDLKSPVKEICFCVYGWGLFGKKYGFVGQLIIYGCQFIPLY